MNLVSGVDLVLISRIQKSIQNQRFLSRVYGEKELDYYNSRGRSTQFLAGNFAAKEAFSKLLGTGIRNFSLVDVQVLRNELGAPYYQLSGQAAKLVEQQQLSLSLSISHEADYAIAFAVGIQQINKGS